MENMNVFKIYMFLYIIIMDLVRIYTYRIHSYTHTYCYYKCYFFRFQTRIFFSFFRCKIIVFSLLFSTVFFSLVDNILFFSFPLFISFFFCSLFTSHVLYVYGPSTNTYNNNNSFICLVFFSFFSHLSLTGNFRYKLPICFSFSYFRFLLFLYFPCHFVDF